MKTQNKHSSFIKKIAFTGAAIGAVSAFLNTKKGQELQKDLLRRGKEVHAKVTKDLEKELSVLAKSAKLIQDKLQAEFEKNAKQTAMAAKGVVKSAKSVERTVKKQAKVLSSSLQKSPKDVK